MRKTCLLICLLSLINLFNTECKDINTSNPEQYFKKLLKSKDTILAESYLNDLIKNNPNNKDFLCIRVNYKYVIKDYKSALKDINKVIKIAPDSIQYYVKRASIHYELGNFKLSVKDLDYVIKYDSLEDFCYSKKAFILLHLKDYKNSLFSINKAIEIKPKIPFYHILKGNIIIESGGDTLETISCFKQAYQLNRSNYDLLKIIGYTYSFIFEYDSTITFFKLYLLRNKNDTKVLRQKALMNLFMGYHQGFLNDIERAYSMDSNKIEYYGSLNFYKSMLNDTIESFNYINKILEIDPRNAKYTFERGIRKLAIGDTTGGIKDLDKAIELDTSEYDRLIHKGNKYFCLKEYSKGMIFLNKAVKLYPKRFNAYTYRIFLKTQLKDSLGAYKDWKVLYNIMNRDLSTFIELSRFFCEFKNYKEALQCYDYILKYAPGLVNIYCQRGKTKFELGDKEGACIDFTKAKKFGYKGLENELKNCKS